MSTRVWLVLVLTLPAFAHASDEAPTDPDTDLEESLFEPEQTKEAQEEDVFKSAIAAESNFFRMEEEIVVTASKRAQPMEQAPARVAVISAEEIRRYGFRTLGEAVRTVAGWYLVENFAFQHAGLRGVNLDGDYGTRILVLVDGHTTNESWSSSSAVGDEFLLPLTLVSRIEVLQGPSSSLYGSNGFFGIINVVSRSAARTGPFADLETGSFGRARATIGVNGKLDSDIDATVALDVLDVSGRSFFYPEHAGGPTAGVSLAQADSEERLAGFLHARYGELTLLAAAVERDRATPMAIFESTFGDPLTHQGQSNAFVELRWERALDEQTNVTVRGYYDRFRWIDDIRYGADADYLDGFVFHDDGHDDAAGLEGRFDLQLFASETLTDRLLVGAETQYHQQLSRAYVAGDPLEYMIEIPTFRVTAAGYFQNELTWAGHGLLIVGTRFDFDVYDSRSFDFQGLGAEAIDKPVTSSAPSPRAALILTPTEAATFKLIYARGFRSASAYERFFDDQTDVRPASADLRPETIDNFELVYEHVLGPHFRLAASLYRFQARDLVGLRAYDDPDIGPAQRFENVDQIDGYGAEMGVRFLAPNGTRAFANASLQNVDIASVEGDVLNSPPILANAGASVPLFEQAVFLSSTLSFVARRLAHTAPELYLPAYAIVNAGVMVRDLFGEEPGTGFQLSGFVYNVLNHSYEDVALEVEVTPILSVPQDRRTFLLKLGYTL